MSLTIKEILINTLFIHFILSSVCILHTHTHTQSSTAMQKYLHRHTLAQRHELIPISISMHLYTHRHTHATERGKHTGTEKVIHSGLCVCIHNNSSSKNYQYESSSA